MPTPPGLIASIRAWSIVPELYGVSIVDGVNPSPSGEEIPYCHCGTCHSFRREVDGHIFITVIAYHLMHTIRFKLRHKGVKFCWATIRRQLSTHVRATTTMKRKDNKGINIHKSSKTEPAHEVIYDALGLPYRPGRTVKTLLRRI